ncbi:MAG: hypothetical protein ACMXX6_00735 [Candidatus Woesearchaeota archaeon]
MKKAQASLEFLSIYSIALVFILTAIVLLGYAFINAESTIQESCNSLSSSFLCENFLINDEGLISFSIKNLGRLPVTLTGATCFKEDRAFIIADTNSGQKLGSRELVRITCDFSDTQIGDDLTSVELLLNYKEYQANFPSSITINLVSKPSQRGRYNCIGIEPTGKGVEKGSLDSNSITAWQSTENIESLGDCQWGCQEGYIIQGNTCVET